MEATSEGQTKRDMTLQTLRSVSEKEYLRALKTKVCLEIIASVPKYLKDYNFNHEIIQRSGPA